MIFQSTKARMAFPCFDEPAYKATFDVTLTVPKEKTALSCTRVKSEVENGDGTKSVSYLTTPIMSTYIVAFCVADLEYLEATTKEGVRVRVYTPPGKSKLAEFALEVKLIYVHEFLLIDFCNKGCNECFTFLRHLL